MSIKFIVALYGTTAIVIFILGILTYRKCKKIDQSIEESRRSIEESKKSIAQSRRSIAQSRERISALRVFRKSLIL